VRAGASARGVQGRERDRLFFVTFTDIASHENVPEAVPARGRAGRGGPAAQDFRVPQSQYQTRATAICFTGNAFCRLRKL
jgi:hypothetical protein